MKSRENNGKEKTDRSRENLTHFDRHGRARMVDVSAKENTLREAYARGAVMMKKSTMETIRASQIAKGDVLGTAQVAAIMAVKETGRLIPMAHPLSVSSVDVDFNMVDDIEIKNKENKKSGSAPTGRVEIGVRVKLTGRTGVEMEALTGVSVAALTIYDMCKSIDKTMLIGNIRLEEKKGGRSGHYKREPGDVDNLE